MERFSFTFWTVLTIVLVHTNCLEQASFYGGSYISVPLKESKSTTDIHFKFRTRLPNALLLLVAGSTDYCIVQLDNGRLKLSINLGAGESEINSPANIKLNDFKWHDIIIVRKEANLSLIVDTIHGIKKQLPGKFFELNVHHGLFIGGRGNYTEIFFGHTGNLRGCMAEVMYNGILVLEQARSRTTQTVVQGVTWNCAAEFEANLNSPISFIEDGAFMAISHPFSHTFKFQMELKTAFTHSVLLYNSGPPSRNDMLAVEVWNGKTRATLKTSKNTTELLANQNVSDGAWHKISLRITPLQMELTVDGLNKNAKLPRIGSGGYHFELVDVYYIGGMEVSKRARAMAKGLKTADANFKGCIKELSLGEQKTGLPYAKITDGLLPGCVWQFPCSKFPCVEDGQCIQQGIDAFSCQCDRDLCVRPNFTEGYKVFGRGSLATDMELLSLEPLHVAEGESVLVSTSNLHLILDYPKYGIRSNGIVFRVVESPLHGSIRIGEWAKRNHFTLADLSEDKVHYIHDGSEHHQDHVLMEMRFSAGDSYTLPAYLQGNFRFTLAINVSRVNDAPKLNVPNTSVLRVAQGARQLIERKLLEVEDPDTPPEQIVYSVVDPGPGNFELLTNPETATKTFTQADINNHQVVYIQNGNVNNSYIHLQVSDGIETSAVTNLRITTFAQHWRLGNNSGLVLMYQTAAYITSSNLSFVSNVPNAIENGQFRIVQPPQFGRIQVEQGDSGNWEVTDLFTSEDLRQHRVRYEHTTGVPDLDEFQFRTTLNSSTLYTFRMTFAKCNFVATNWRPLNLNSSLEAVITSAELQYQTEPVRTSSTSITYRLTKAPIYGYLFSAVSKYVLKENDSFMQEDIALENIMYKLYRRPYSYIADTVGFRIIAPGCRNISGNVSIVHFPAPETKSKVHVTLKTLRVDEGANAGIDTELLNIRTDFLTDLTVNVTREPERGFLYVTDADGTAIKRNRTDYFTWQELLNKQIYYRHDDSETNHDSFDFLAISNEAENFLYADKYDVQIMLKNDNMPTRAVDRVFYVVVGGQRLLTGEDLRYVDVDFNTKPSDIIYTCREITNGGLYEADVPTTEVTEFSQQSLNNGEILFKHKGAESGKIKLWVTDGQFYVNGILEIQASAPFVRPNVLRKLVVQFGKSKLIRMEHLSSTTNLYAKHQDIIYEIMTKPNYGHIERRDKRKKISQFSQYDILEENILYVHEGSAGTVDEVRFRVKCHDAVAVIQMGIWILPEVYWDPLTVKTLKTLTVEESTSALITKNTLDVVQANVPAGVLTFHVTDHPQAGYLDILNSNQHQTTTAVQQSNNIIKSFTQLVIYEKRLVYIQSGANVTNDRIVFNVTNGIVWQNDLVLDVQIIPENLYIGSADLTVEEGGTAPLTTANLFVQTHYYSTMVTDYVIMQQPKYGCVQVQRQCTKMHGFSHKQLLAKMVHYYHDGSENLNDEIAFVAVAGQKRSIPVTLRVSVRPVNDHKPKLVNNTALMLFEGGAAFITSDLLAAIDYDQPQEVLQYYVLGCWWGYLFLKTEPNVSIQTFSQKQIDNGLIGFKHQNGSEAKFIFNISDGVHFTKEHSFHVRTKPCKLRLQRNVGLHVFPLQKQYLSFQHLLATVSDVNRTITFDVTTPPTLGRLMTESENFGTYKVIKTFTQDSINNSKIFYEHTHPFTGLYANDSFVFDVKSHMSDTLAAQKFSIDISVSSGGLDAYVNVPRIVVDEGGMVSIPLNLSSVVTFLENHAGLRSPVIHASTTPSQHGQVFLSYSSNQTTFTQAQVESGQIHYQHDHSDSLSDNVHFSLYLIPGYIMLCNVTVPVIVNPINDQPFKLVTPAPSIVVVQGENHTILRSEFLTEDADTPPAEIRYDIIRGPFQGSVVLLPEAVPINQFSQADVDAGLLVYVHNGSVLTDDKFDFRVWDGKFRPEYTLFNVIVLPVSINVTSGLPVYLQQGSNVVSLSPSQFYMETNANKDKVHYSVRQGPNHGVIYVRDKPANSFRQTDLENDYVMYMQTDMTTSNDSFRLFVGLDSGNATVGSEIQVFVQVQPLMQLANFTVLAGESNRLTLHVLDATPLAKLTNSNPKYTIIQGPRYGEIRKIIRSSGERRNILDTPVQNFYHEEVLSGLLYIVMKDVEVGWGGLQDKLVFVLAASIFQPAVGELRITVRSGLLNEIYSTLAGPNDPAGHEGGMHMASPNMTRDYFLIVSMVAGVVILGIAVIIIIKCRNLEISELQKENQCMQPIPLPRPPDRLMTSTPPLKHQIQETYEASPISTALPHCKVTPLNCGDLDTHTRYPYGVDEQLEDWSNCDSDPTATTRNVMLRRNQYWV